MICGEFKRYRVSSRRARGSTGVWGGGARWANGLAGDIYEILLGRRSCVSAARTWLLL